MRRLVRRAVIAVGKTEREWREALTPDPWRAVSAGAISYMVRFGLEASETEEVAQEVFPR